MPLGDRKSIQLIRTSASKPAGMAVNASGGYSPKYHVHSKGLSCEDAQEKDEWRLRIKVITG